jgi:hypothetical protein
VQFLSLYGELFQWYGGHYKGLVMPLFYINGRTFCKTQQTHTFQMLMCLLNVTLKAYDYKHNMKERLFMMVCKLMTNCKSFKVFMVKEKISNKVK